MIDNTAIGAPTVPHRLIREHWHDPERFTQGLELHDGVLWESVGLYGRSAVYGGTVGKVEARYTVRLPPQLFGEGLTVVGNRIIQLTWREGLALIFDLALRPISTVRYEGEGWGLDGFASPGSPVVDRLVLSDGSSVLKILAASSLEPVGRLQVREEGRPVDQLNELEVVDSWILANIWHSDRIAVIDRDSGAVAAWLNLGDLKKRLPASMPTEHVLNGIAFDPRTGHILVTGKCWPKLFELSVDLPKRTHGNPGQTLVPGDAPLQN